MIVTGARGYLGARIVAGLSGIAEVAAIARPGSQRADDYAVDLLDRRALARLMAEFTPDHVIHASGRVSGAPDELHRDNVATTLTLGEAVAHAAPRAILTVLGSAAEYGLPCSSALIAETHPCAPVTAYGRAKLEATRGILALSERHGLRANIVRPFNLIDAPLSPAQVLGAFVAHAAAVRHDAPPREIAMGPLGAIRDFVAVGDLVHLLATLIQRDRNGVLVNVCSGEGRCVRDIVHRLNALAGHRFKIIEPTAQVHGANAIVGDPARFRALTGRVRPTPIEPLIRRAWREAIGAL